MGRQAIKREFPLGNPVIDGKLYDPVTAAVVVTAGASIYGAVEAHKQGKRQERATKRSETAAATAQAEQEAFALEEKKVADTKLEEQRARILKGQQGRGGLLFGSELGTQDKKQTLGA